MCKRAGMRVRAWASIRVHTCVGAYRARVSLRCCTFLLSHLSHENLKEPISLGQITRKDSQNEGKMAFHGCCDSKMQELDAEKPPKHPTTNWNTSICESMWQMWQQKSNNFCPYARTRARVSGDYGSFHQKTARAFTTQRRMHHSSPFEEIRTFSLSQMSRTELARVMPWRENEGWNPRSWGRNRLSEGTMSNHWRILNCGVLLS